MCRPSPSPPLTNTNNNNNNKPVLVENLTNNNNNNKKMETPLLHTAPQPAKANKRKRLNAVLDKLAGNMGMENMDMGVASTMNKMASSNNEESRPAATHLEISLSVAEERSTSEESEEERPHSSSSAVSSPKNEKEDASFSPSSNPFLSSLINPINTSSTPPGLDYLKSQLLSKMYLQQYMTNNLANPVLPATRTPEAADGRRNPKESKKEVKRLEGRRESKESRKEQLRDSSAECSGPLDLSRTSGPPSLKQSSPQPPPVNEENPLNKKFPFPPFPSLLLPSSSSSSSPSLSSNSKEEEGASPPPPSPPSKTSTTSTNSKGVVEASASPPASTYSCPVCGQKFSLHDRLAKHMASRHKAHKVESQSKAYFCEVRKRRKTVVKLHFRRKPQSEANFSFFARCVIEALQGATC